MTIQHPCTAEHSGTPGAHAEREDAGGLWNSPPPAEVGGADALWWVELIETRQRELDATRLTLIAAAMDQVVRRGAEGPEARERSAADRDLAYRALRAELATLLNLGEHQVETQMDLAYRLTNHYPGTLAALERGEISSAHSRVLADEGAVIGTGESPVLRERRAGYEREALEFAAQESPNRLRPVARRLAEKWADRDLEERHREAVSERRIVVIDREEGMSDLIAHLPSLEAHAIKNRLDRIARAAERNKRTVRERAERGAPEPSRRRTRDQLRTDVFSDLLLASDEYGLFAGSTVEAIRATVQVVVPVEVVQTGMGAGSPAASSEPCELLGSGSLSAGTARSLLAEASHWERVEQRPETGEVLSVERYRPSERMRRLLGTRDRHCRFPGCRVPVSRCDLDHTVDAAKGGPTASDNLAHLCRGHHTLKHHGGWRVAQESGGVMRWSSPSGRDYVDRPPGRTALGRGDPVRFTSGSPLATENPPAF